MCECKKDANRRVSVLKTHTAKEQGEMNIKGVIAQEEKKETRG